MADPFFDFWEMMNSNSRPAPTLAAVGRVTSLQPLCVQIMGLAYKSPDLKINAHLPLDDAQAGDEVFCLTNDDWQTIFVLCKVVSA